MGDQDAVSCWPSPEDYGSRFEAIDRRLARSFVLAEYRGSSLEDVEVLQYRLAKLALAAEDIRAAIAVIERGDVDDGLVARAVVELRNACAEVMDSFSEANEQLVRLLNFTAS